MKISSKGQLTVPKEVRQALGVNSGDELAIDVVSEGEARLRKAKGLLEVAGSVRVPPHVRDMSWHEVKRKAHREVARRAAVK